MKWLSLLGLVLSASAMASDFPAPGFYQSVEGDSLSIVALDKTSTRFAIALETVYASGCRYPEGKALAAAQVVMETDLRSSDVAQGGSCEVAIFKSGENRVNVETTGDCSQYCGLAGGPTLDVSDLVLVKTKK